MDDREGEVHVPFADRKRNDHPHTKHKECDLNEHDSQRADISAHEVLPTVDGFGEKQVYRAFFHERCDETRSREHAEAHGEDEEVYGDDRPRNVKNGGVHKSRSHIRRADFLRLAHAGANDLVLENEKRDEYENSREYHEANECLLSDGFAECPFDDSFKYGHGINVLCGRQCP